MSSDDEYCNEYGALIDCMEGALDLTNVTEDSTFGDSISTLGSTNDSMRKQKIANLRR